jgi:hypothetical protein
VNVEDVARPFASVVCISVLVEFDANVPLAPVSAGAVNVTDTPGIGVPPVATSATSGAPNAVPTAVVCGVPLFAVTASTGAVFVRLKLTDGTPKAEAVTTYAPPVAFAVNVEEVARPFTSVVSVSVDTPPTNVPVAPGGVGAVNVTDTPLVGIPPVVTIATSGNANAVLTGALCGVPLCATIATTGAGGFELLQPGRKTKAREFKARMLA